MASLLLALAWHGALVLFLSLLSTPRPPRTVARPVTVRRFSARQWEKNRGNASAAVARRERPAPNGQIVDVAPGNGRETERARYVAETSNTVAAETRAREQVQRYSRATAKTSANPEALPSGRGSLGGRTAKAPKPVGLMDRLSAWGGRQPRLSELVQPALPGPERPDADPSEHPGLPSGDPSIASAGDAAEEGGGAPNDDLRDVAAGDGTYLNTREWQYAGFFNRVKQAVSARWDPNGRLRARDPSGRAGILDRVTVLQVALRADGSLADCFVARSSGLDYLDLEAVQSFERAQPFPNPPPALVRGGLIRFSFGFTLSHEPGGLPQLFRPGRP